MSFLSLFSLFSLFSVCSGFLVWSLLCAPSHAHHHTKLIVHNTQIYPCVAEFNSTFLSTLMDEVYNCRFGTFLCKTLSCHGHLVCSCSLVLFLSLLFERSIAVRASCHHFFCVYFLFLAHSLCVRLDAILCSVINTFTAPLEKESSNHRSVVESIAQRIRGFSLSSVTHAYHR